jgi:lipoyl(octanoyl) transferase
MTPRADIDRRSGKPALTILDLGTQPYEPVLRMQEERLAARQRGEVPDALILVEHAPVYTMGRSAKPENLILPEAECLRQGIAVFKTGRGGDITYHGPGQLVAYPIIDLTPSGLGAADYVGRLESLIQAVLRDFGVESSTDPKHRGVWIGDSKIAAIGVRIARHVTMHGFALNVRVDLAHYSGIVPCGIADRGVTSLHLLRPDIAMDAVKERVVARFEEAFGYTNVEGTGGEQQLRNARKSRKVGR